MRFATRSRRLRRGLAGLVYERHIPETLCLGVNGGLRVGDHVRMREDLKAGESYRVTSINASKATVSDQAGETASIPIKDVLVIRRFGESIYPTLTSLGSVERSADRPYHAVINSENYHALQLLLHTCKSQVDCIYIDPPYNSGARDWSTTTIERSPKTTLWLSKNRRTDLWLTLRGEPDCSCSCSRKRRVGR